MAISTNGAIITRLTGALYGEYLSNASYKEVSATDPSVLAANWLKADFGSKTDTQIATTVLTNLGLSEVAGLSNWLAAQLTGAGSAGKGAKLVSLLNDFAGMTADATYGAKAIAFNSKVSASLTTSQTADAAGGSFATSDTVAPVVAASFALTTGADVADNVSSTRGALSSTFNFTSGNDTVTGTVNTLTTTDVLVDSSTTDNDTLTVAISAATDSGSASFTTENIETFNITAGAGGNGDLDMTNVTGLKNLNVTGSGNFTISDLNAQTQQPTIAVNNYTRVLTIAPDTLAGTTKGENPDTVNISVSGGSYGTLASAQTAVVIDAATTAGTVETLNINSAGTAANEFALSLGTSDSFETINFTGTTAITARVAAAAVSGVVVAGAAGSNATLMVNRETASTLDATNFSGVTIAMYDPTPSDADYANATLKDGAGVTFLNNFAATTSTVQGAVYTALAAATTVTLDNSKDATNVTVASLGMQNVKAITINSKGNADEETYNKITTLTGDFSTITINGDTPFQTKVTIDAAQTTASTSTTARAVAITAAGLTGTANATITTGATSLYTSYSITGSGNDDTLSVASDSTLGATLTGGAGNDTLTGALGNDTISGGDGDDTINTSFGADKITGGNGIDTIVVVDDSGTATAQVSRVSGLASLFENGGNADIASATADTFTVTIDGVEYSVAPVTAGDTDATIYAKFVTDHKAAILANHGITAAVSTTVTDTYTVDFTVADIGTATAGDTIALDVTGSSTDLLFTRNSSGGWDNSVSTSTYSLSYAGSEVTITNSGTGAAAFGLTEGSTATAATIGGVTTAIALGTGSDTAESSVTLANEYLTLTGRADGTAFTPSASYIDASASKTSTVTSSTPTAAVTQPDLSTTITDFATADILDLSALMTGDIDLATSLNATNIDTANVILLTTGTGYASVTAAETATAAASSSTGAAIVIFLNTTTGKVQAYRDADVGSTGTIDTTLEITQATLFTFDNLTSLVGISSTFAAGNFIFG